jgi:hypothetical protein
VLEELVRKVVEVVGDAYLATERAEGIRDGTTLLHRYESSHRTARALDDDLLAAFHELDKTRQLALGFVHTDLDHAKNGTGLARTD